jgi:hypothetical protein
MGHIAPDVVAWPRFETGTQTDPNTRQNTQRKEAMRICCTMLALPWGPCVVSIYQTKALGVTAFALKSAGLKAATTDPPAA